jgi:hypothetical protein
VSKLSKFIKAWGENSLGATIREWWNSQPPNPWPDEIQEAVHQEGAIRICHRCLTPQEHLGWFCPECGTATGPYNNYMPLVYIWSKGEVLRAGVNSEIKFHRWVIPTYFLVGVTEYFIFAPIYWFRLWLGHKKRREYSKNIDHELEV